MTYAAETWALTNQAKNTLAAVQTKMDRIMLNITYQHKQIKTSRYVRRQMTYKTVDKSEFDNGSVHEHQ